MPIKRIPAPRFLPSHLWQTFDSGLLKRWQLAAELSSESDDWYGDYITYLVLTYRTGKYTLYKVVRDEYSSPDEHDPYVGGYIDEQRVLWEGTNPDINELNAIVKKELREDRSIDRIFPLDESDFDYEDDHFIFAPDCEFPFMNLYGDK